MKRETWLNIYEYPSTFIYGTSLYSSPKKATRALCDKAHYKHTINVETGEIRVMNLQEQQNDN